MWERGYQGWTTQMNVSDLISGIRVGPAETATLTDHNFLYEWNE